MKTLSEDQQISLLITQVLKEAFTQATIDYIQGMIEAEENKNDLLQNEEQLVKFLSEIIVGKSKQQISIFAKQIVSQFCKIKNIPNKEIDDQEEEEEQQKLSKEEILEMEKQKQQKIENLKKIYSEIIEDFETIDWNEETIQEYEMIKQQQEVANKYGCVLCERIIPLTFHHLIPRTTHSKPYNKDKTSKELNQGIWICRQCHSGIHNIIDEETMALSYYNFDLIMQHEGVLKMAKYMSKQKISYKQDQRIFELEKHLTSNRKERLI